MERKIGASRSGLKSQRIDVRDIPFNGDKSDTDVFSKSNDLGDRSDTFVDEQPRTATFMPFRGDRSDTGVLLKPRCVSGMPFSGDRSDTFVYAQYRTVSSMSFSGDRSDTGEPLQSRYSNFMPFSGDRSDTRVFKNTRCVSFMSFSGDRSDTDVTLNSSLVSFMSFSGDRSASGDLVPDPSPTLHWRVRSPVSARSGEMSFTLSVANCKSVTTPNSMVRVTMPS